MNFILNLFKKKKNSTASEIHELAKTRSNKLIEDYINSILPPLLEEIKKEAEQGGFSICYDADCSPKISYSEELEDALKSKLGELGFYCSRVGSGEDSISIYVNWRHCN